jgi:hypothetical protein
VKKNIGIALIVILGICLRLICINKPDGLWNDEYVSWMVSAIPFTKGFLAAVKSQCHMPFYYFYLKFFMALCGQNDLILRLTSVFAGVISIPVMYLLGLEKDKQTAYLCSGFCAISSFLIYYSQEVRLYSLLFLISALCLLYTIRFIKNVNRRNLILCLFFNFLILFTHTIGFVFVFFDLVFISLNIFEKHKKAVIYTWSTISVCLIGTLPFAIKIMTTRAFSQWWGHFSISKIVFLFTDYFSPVLTNLTNAPDNFLYAPKLAIFMIIPTAIAILFIIKSLNSKINRQLLGVALCCIFVLALAAISGKLVFITKYSIEIYPILILLACSAEFDNKVLRNVLISIFCIISLGYLCLYPYSAPKIRRAEGHKIACDLIKNSNLKKDDIIILQYYPQDRFEKYFDFSDYRVISINKGNFFEYISPNSTYADVYKNGKVLYKDIFTTQENPYLNNLLKENVFDNMKAGQSVVMVLLDSVSYLNPEKLAKIVKNEALYKKEPLLFLVFSYIKNQTFEDMLKTLSVEKIDRKGNWTIVKFTKLNNN